MFTIKNTSFSSKNGTEITFPVLQKPCNFSPTCYKFYDLRATLTPRNLHDKSFVGCMHNRSDARSRASILPELILYHNLIFP
jgi:hypothetical protein